MSNTIHHVVRSRKSTLKKLSLSLKNGRLNAQRRHGKKKTRQSEFLKMFPRVRTDDDGVIYMDPCDVDTSYENENRCDNIPCRDCKKEYWLAEVE